MSKVYLISCGDVDGKKYKIGFTKKPIDQRLKQLKTGNHQELTVETIFESKWATKIEAQLHRNYGDRKVSGEWFDLTQTQVENFLIQCSNLHYFYEDWFKNSTFKNPRTIFNF